MCTIISATIKNSACILLLAICFGSFIASGQQYVIANKDNTRPEVAIQISAPAFVTSFSVERWNGYNEISWSALREQDIRRYIVEYSTDGVNYETASEVMAANRSYSIQHQLLYAGPIVYRIKMELVNNKFIYQDGIAVDGINSSPVQIYPTIIQGNIVNINAYWPVERITITSGSGSQVYTKDTNGQKDFMSISIPSFGRGLYWMTFYGRGWKTTNKFIIE